MPPSPIPETPWPQLPEAAALLAECAATPPPTRVATVRDLTTFHAREYTGPLVRQLRAIHRREAERLFAAAELSRDYAAFDAHCRLSVQAAIEAAVSSRSTVQSRKAA